MILYIAAIKYYHEMDILGIGDNKEAAWNIVREKVKKYIQNGEKDSFIPLVLQYTLNDFSEDYLEIQED